MPVVGFCDFNWDDGIAVVVVDDFMVVFVAVVARCDVPIVDPLVTAVDARYDGNADWQDDGNDG